MKAVDRTITASVLLLVALPRMAGAQYDSTVYADQATARLVEAARRHHWVRTDQIEGYRAKIVTRSEGRIGAGRFARGVRLFDYQAAAIVHWQSPGDVRVDVQGARINAARLPLTKHDQLEGYWTDLFTGEPWFIAGSLGDEIQIMGIPDEPALHPLARRGARYYRYAVTDSLQMRLPGRTVRAVAVSVEPTREAPALLSGTMWLDADSLEVVRLMASVVGYGIWEDDPDSPVLRTMEIDVEYGLHENRFWLPYRQILAATFDYKYLPGATLPATAVTTFSDYDISVDTAIAFTRLGRGVTGWRFGGRWDCEPWEWDVSWNADAECGAEPFIRTEVDENGNRWEIAVPSMDSLRRYDFGVELEAAETLATEDLIRERLGDMASISEITPAAQLRQSSVNVDWGRVLQAFQYNRVQGPSLGGGYIFKPGPSFTTLHVAGRFSFGDRRPMGSVTWRRDAPRGRLDIDAFRALRYAEPWTEGTPIGNSLKALFSGHDDADYYLALGGGIRFSGYDGLLRDVDMTLRFERQRSMTVESGSGINDFFFGSGVFQSNPPIAEGDYVRAAVTRTWHGDRSVFKLGIGGLVGKDLAGVRAWGSVTMPYWVENASGFLRVRAGAMTGDPLPQLHFRVGGPETVRGYTYGARRGEHFWSVQWEQELGGSPRWVPVVFVDAGDVVTSSYRFDPLVGLGGGISFLSGWVRLDFAKGVNPAVPLRADLLFRMPL